MKKSSKSSKKLRAALLYLFAKLLFLPVLFVWLELVLHISMGMQMKYFPIYFLHGLMYGFFFSGLCAIVPKKGSLNAVKVVSIVVSVIFCVEFVAKNILQDFYPASMLKTAMGNHLTDYIGAILSLLAARIIVILLFMLPSVLSAVFIKYNDKVKMKPAGTLILSFAAAIAFFVLGLLAIIFPWRGEPKPRELYMTDTAYNDQVEQLGLANFLRLDFKHMIWPVENSMEPVEPVVTDDPEPPTDTSNNMISLDFDAMLKTAPNKNVESLIKYFSSVAPTKKNEYTGIFKDYNVVFFTVEGLSGYGISQELTPTLYKLTHEGFVFNNFHTALHFTSTSNGECQNLLGLYPKNGDPITMSRTGDLKTNTYFALARQFGRLGYESWGYHNNINMYNRAASHSNLGYNWRYIHYTDSYKMYEDCIAYEGEKGLSQGKLRWPQRDSFLVEHTVDDYIDSDKPFNAYYMTITGHTPYTYTSWVFSEWRDTVAKLNYTDKTKAYLASVMEFDKSVKLMMDRLQAAGKLDKTVIVFVPDHIPYFDIDTLEELTGRKFGDTKDFQSINERNIDFDVYKSCLAIWSPSISDKTIEIDKVCCQVDILPTLSNLLGLEYDSRMLAGTDILSTSEGLVVFSSRSWRTNMGTYNRYSKEFTPAAGVSLSGNTLDAYIKYINSVVNNRTSMTAVIVENDFYNFALGTSKFRYEPGTDTGVMTKKQLREEYSHNYMDTLFRADKITPDPLKHDMLR